MAMFPICNWQHVSMIVQMVNTVILKLNNALLFVHKIFSVMTQLNCAFLIKMTVNYNIVFIQYHINVLEWVHYLIIINI